MDELEPLYISGGIGNVAAAVEDSTEAIHKVKHRIIVQPSNSTPRFTLEKLKTSTQILTHECS